MAYDRAGKHEEAINPLQMWTILEPGKAMAWEALGVAQRKSGHLDAALDSLAQAISLAPQNASALYQLGLVFSKKGDRAKVKEIAERLQPLDPTLAARLLQHANPH